MAPQFTSKLNRTKCMPKYCDDNANQSRVQAANDYFVSEATCIAWQSSQLVRTVRAAVLCALRATLEALAQQGIPEAVQMFHSAAGSSDEAVQTSALPKLQSAELKQGLASLFTHKAGQQEPLFTLGAVVSLVPSMAELLMHAAGVQGAPDALQHCGHVGSAPQQLGVEGQGSGVVAYLAWSWPLADMQWRNLAQDTALLSQEVDSLLMEAAAAAGTHRHPFD
jgi:hypothetical protein